MSPRESATRRFAIFWGLSVAWKLVALAVFVGLVVVFVRGGGL